jgi:hypothetical protein
MTIDDAPKRQQRLAEKVDSQTIDLCESSARNARVTPSEERIVLDWIGAKRRGLRLEKLASMRAIYC